MAESESFEQTYECAFDLPRNRSFVKAFLRANWRKMIWSGIQWGVLFAMIALIGFWTAQYYVENGEPVTGAYTCVVVMLIAGPIFVWYWTSNANERADNRNLRERWSCTLCDEFWSFRSSSGVETRIPWKEMKLEFEHPEGWYVNYTRSSVIVYREPLRAAGLEEEFRSRIGVGKPKPQ